MQSAYNKIKNPTKVKGGVNIFYGMFDGSSLGNPGPGGAGAMIVNSEGEVLVESSRFLGVVTNNEAEYEALILLLENALRFGIKNIVIQGDSQLVINQVNGLWKIKKDTLRELYKQAYQLLNEITAWELLWVPREQNKNADRLSRMVIPR